MSQREQTKVGDRDVHIVTGRISQTVNVCTPANERGKYDWIIRLTPQHFVDKSQVEAHASLNSLIEWLTGEEQIGQVEQRPTGEGTEAHPQANETVPEVSPTDPDDAVWIERAMRITEVCIDELVREFLELPYLHRVEHSIHTRLYAILSTQPHFDRHFSLAGGKMLTQPIHKEWPETIPRPEKGNRRGNFDLAILSPNRLRECSLRDFSTGRIVPPIVIEMGLNYGEGHLALDAEKLLNSRVQHGYLVHLVREMPHDPTIDETIERLRSEGTVKVAFARYDESGRKYAKLLADPQIREVSSVAGW
ncbi:hypothetical protein B188_28370 [Candidatus Brocadiaceae bacterium B188]|nr:hypothetical protein [Candidatus Brocadia sapporoensis]QQR65511.1 MAG: hypothetical protein IPI25_07830 [Candidatus Brocadia sp.]RZV57230.1 MAG: hypothetical protein EX330_10150 [Candidatus Brocadia sp. BROELEC01]TWU50405.1 hypothetical protein B188_28370 [Candidatus Brocadiaceae bacterium B188]